MDWTHRQSKRYRISNQKHNYVSACGCFRCDGGNTEPHRDKISESKLKQSKREGEDYMSGYTDSMISINGVVFRYCEAELDILDVPLSKLLPYTKEPKEESNYVLYYDHDENGNKVLVCLGIIYMAHT
jgi:hypothetical protein